MTSSNSLAATPNWQGNLQDYSRKLGLGAPVYTLYSDRRGCRTAWSASVSIPGFSMTTAGVFARMWYDGEHNAKEDAAEVALQQLLQRHTQVSESPRSMRIRAGVPPRSHFRPN